MDNVLFQTHSVTSNRILYTPSTFAKTNLIHLQEAGTLSALKPHTSRREKLSSYLFFLVKKGSGTVYYEGRTIEVFSGQCVFLDCQKPYSHSCSSNDLWELSWVHFYGPTMQGIYEKYRERGGAVCFTPKEKERYKDLLKAIFELARTDDSVKDMRLFAKFADLLTCLIDEDTREEKPMQGTKLLPVKAYLDLHYVENVKLDDLAAEFYLNKFYLTRLFKSQFGTSINAYIIHKRITKAKELLRFSDQSVEEIGQLCGVDDPAYFSRLFKKVEGTTPLSYRKLWAKS